MRFDFQYSTIPEQYIVGHMRCLIYLMVITIIVFYFNKMYHSIWRLASMAELKRVVTSFLILIPLYVIGYACIGIRMPISYCLMGYVISFCLVTACRFSFRIYRTFTERHRQEDTDDTANQDRVMIIGAGVA